MKNEEAVRHHGGACVVKKYPNRRLYDTCASAYVTLSDIKQRVVARQPFEVRDARTGQDITRSILLQILLEAEGGPAPMLSTEGLAGIIRLYGHARQNAIGSQLEQNIRHLQAAQEPTATPEPLPATPWSPPAMPPGLTLAVGAVSGAAGRPANIA